MTTAREVARRRYAERVSIPLTAGAVRVAREDAFVAGAEWLAQQPVEITDEMVRDVAAAINDGEQQRAGLNTVGGGIATWSIAAARDALHAAVPLIMAALGEEQDDD